MTDALSILQDLIRYESVTPHEGGALDYIEKILRPLGFECHRLVFKETGTPDVDNLYARWGKAAPHFCFAGHTDVVPIGKREDWTVDPFGAEIKDKKIYGRGAADMKGSIAAFLSAAIDIIKTNPPQGSISFLLTGDEEGPAINGTKKVLEWLSARGEKIDFCLVGEPTSRDKLGDMVKIGRRGTQTGRITVTGKQGHVAYPHLADNPIPKLLKLLAALDALELDQGTAHFDPSNLEIVNIDIGNTADNVIPAAARATFNTRFNDSYTSATLEKKIRETLDKTGIGYNLTLRTGGESFYTPPGIYSDLVKKAIEETLKIVPDLSTTGGTSDARFIRSYCPVIEFGIVGKTAHQVDEHVTLGDLSALTKAYHAILGRLYSQAQVEK